MQGSHTLDRKEKDRLKDLVTFFGFRVPHLQMVKVDKMIYIAQLYHYSTYGELLTDVPFLSLSRGPHSPVIRSFMEELIERKVIYIEQNRSEIESANPCLLIKSDTPGTDHLPGTCLHTLETVLEEWGKEKFGKVLDYFTRTISFLSTPYKEAIDFKKIQPFAGLREVLALPQRRLIHRFVQYPGEAVDDESDFDLAPSPVSMQEVVEIYLCLCDTKPQGILSSEYRGFDGKTLVEILERLGDTNGSGQSEKETDVSRAARYTELLARSRCFRHENEKVAFQVGRLFLKKRGYSLDQRLGGTNSLKGHAEIKAWFEGISKGS